jgi:glucose/arabinose dehydrogenase/PKD repeat protein
VLAVALAVVGLTGCLPSGFHDYVVFDDLEAPTAVEFSPDGRIFVAEKRGVVKAFDGVADRTPTVVADLRTNVYNGWDRGLLGLALDPDFPQTPDIYVLYTYDAVIGGTAPRWGRPGVDIDPCPDPPGWNDDGCVVSGRLSRLRLGSGGVSGPEQVLIEDWCQQYPSHSIGTLAFGADGALYVGAGDGASFAWADYGQEGDPPNPCRDPGADPDGVMRPPRAEGGSLRSQDLRTTGDPVGLDGTIIRIDPATGEALPTNPLAAHPDPNARRIVADGLRNPFRFTVRPGTNELWIGDVGWEDWEEINVTQGDDAAVDNFGWPCLEGRGRGFLFDRLDLAMCEDLYARGGTTSSVFEFRHGTKVANEICPTDQGSAISGLAFTPPGSPYPASYDGALFFADAARQCIFVMRAGPDGEPDPTRVRAFHQSPISPVEIEFGPGGELWYVDLYGGSVHRIGYSSTNAPPQAAFTATPFAGDPPLTVSFDGRRSADPDAGDTLAYAWDLDGDGEFDDGTTPTATYTYETAGTRAVGLRVTDAVGASDTGHTTLWVGTSEPVLSIGAPQEEAIAAVGEQVAFSGGASTPDGDLPPSALSWRVDMLHCGAPDQCHRHPDVFALDGASSGSFPMPDHEYPAHVELRLAATWEGQTVTATRRIDYRTVEVSLAADVDGVSLTLGSRSSPAPFSRDVPEGSKVTVSAPATVTSETGSFAFASWSDGGAQTHEIVVPAAPVTLTAHYVPDG